MRASLLTISLALAMMMGLVACDRGDDKVDPNLVVAENYLRKNEYVKAEKHYQNALDRDKQSLPALSGLARIAELQGQFVQAESYYQKILAVDADNLAAQMGLARLFLRGDRIEEAIALEEKLAVIGTDNVKVLLLRLDILSAAKNQQAANGMAQLLLQLGNTDKQIYAAVIQYYQNSQQYQKATDSVDRALVDFPDEPEFYRQKMFGLYSAEKFDDIEKTFHQLIDEKPQLVEVYFLLADYYINRGNNQAAVEIVDTLILNVSLNEDLLIRSAQAYKRLGRQQLAVELLEKYETTFLDAWRPKLLLAEEYASIDQRDKAESIFVSLASEYETMGGEADDPATIIALSYANFKRKSDIAFAHKLVDKVLAQQPKNSEALLLSAQLFNKKKDYRATIANLRDLIAREPDNILAILLMAEAHKGLRQYDSAVVIYETALEKLPNNKLLVINYLQLLLDKGDVTKAYDKSQYWLRRYPDDVELIELQARIVLATKSFDKLFPLASKLQSLQGKTVFNRYIEGVAYANDNQRDKAINILKEVNLLDPNHYPSAVGLTQLYGSAKQMDKALVFFQGIENKTAVTYFSMGRIYSLKNQLGNANKAYQQAIKLSPEDPRAYLVLANNYFSQANYAASEQVLQSASQVITDNPLVYYQLGGVLLQQEKYADALSAYKQSIDLQPDNILAANNYLSVLADHYSSKVELQKAEPIASRLVDVDDANIKDTLGWFYYHLGDNYKAALYAQDAVKKQPKVAVFHFHLGMIYKRQQRDKLAQSTLEKAIELAAPGEPWLEEARAAL